MSPSDRGERAPEKTPPAGPSGVARWMERLVVGGLVLSAAPARADVIDDRPLAIGVQSPGWVGVVVIGAIALVALWLLRRRG